MCHSVHFRETKTYTCACISVHILTEIMRNWITLLRSLRHITNCYLSAGDLEKAVMYNYIDIKTQSQPLFEMIVTINVTEFGFILILKCLLLQGLVRLLNQPVLCLKVLAFHGDPSSCPGCFISYTAPCKWPRRSSRLMVSDGVSCGCYSHLSSE